MCKLVEFYINIEKNDEQKSEKTIQNLMRRL